MKKYSKPQFYSFAINAAAVMAASSGTWNDSISDLDYIVSEGNEID